MMQSDFCEAAVRASRSGSFSRSECNHATCYLIQADANLWLRTTDAAPTDARAVDIKE